MADEKKEICEELEIRIKKLKKQLYGFYYGNDWEELNDYITFRDIGKSLGYQAMKHLSAEEHKVLKKRVYSIAKKFNLKSLTSDDSTIKFFKG